MGLIFKSNSQVRNMVNGKYQPQSLKSYVIVWQVSTLTKLLIFQYEFGKSDFNFL